MHRQQHISLWQLAWRRLRRNRGAVIGLALLVGLIVVAIAAPLIAPMDPTVQVLEYAIKPPMFRETCFSATILSTPIVPA